MGLVRVFEVAGPVVGRHEGFAGAAHDADAPAERNRGIRTVEGADLHEQAEGVAGVDGQGEGPHKAGFIGDSQCVGHGSVLLVRGM